MIPAYPKIYTMGMREARKVFNGPVEITEKIDGSQFSFGMVSGTLYARSKGASLDPYDARGMFGAGLTHVVSRANILPVNTVFHVEYMQKLKHNKIAYDRMPYGGMVLYAMRDLVTDEFALRSDLEYWAEELQIDVSKMIRPAHWGMHVANGLIEGPDQIRELLGRESYLGGHAIEGVVIKNYAESSLHGDELVRHLAVKLVSEEFKEKNHGKQGPAGVQRDKWTAFKDRYQNKNRWEKAYQHLRDDGGLEQTPRDIGRLIAEVRRDLAQECRQEIMDHLFVAHFPDLATHAIKGLPEWYKDKLLELSFDDT